MMTGSFNFFLHLIVFGSVVGVFVSLYILEYKTRIEKEWERKLFIGGIMRTIASITPFNILLLAITGFGNMVNRYGLNSPWPQEQWLMVKIVLFVILSANALYVGPHLNMNRARLIKSVAENSAPVDVDKQFALHNKKISLFLLIQTVLLLAIVLLSVFGDGKHPGIF
ncbi:MAG: CopD family protein [Bacteroidota bacterium]|nr:CopD family protein [Bacteroidota bacterium]